MALAREFGYSHSVSEFHFSIGGKEPRSPNTVSHEAMKELNELCERLTQALRRRAWRDVRRVAAKILRAEPSYLIARESMAQAHWHLGEYAKCQKVAQTLSMLHPSESSYFMLQGVCHRLLGRYQAALECLHQALLLADRVEARSQVQQQIDDVESIVALSIQLLVSNDPEFAKAFEKDAGQACAAIGLSNSSDSPPYLPAMFVWPSRSTSRPS